MLDKRKAALIILDKLDQAAPVIIDWNKKEFWIKAIISGLKEVEKAEIPGAANSQEINISTKKISIV